MKRGKSKADAPKKAESKLAVRKESERACKKPMKTKAEKDPNKPKRPPFFVFMEEFRKTYEEKHPYNKSVAAVGKAAGDKWNSLSEDDKASYVAKAAKLKTEGVGSPSSGPFQLYREGALTNTEIMAAVDRLLRIQQQGRTEAEGLHEAIPILIQDYDRSRGLLREVRKKNAQQELRLRQLEHELADAQRRLQQRQNILSPFADEASLRLASVPRLVDIAASPEMAPVLVNAATSPVTAPAMADAATDPKSPGTPFVSGSSYEEIVELEVARRLDLQRASFFQSPEFIKVLATRNSQMLRYGFKGALRQCIEKGWIPKDANLLSLSWLRVWDELPPSVTADELLLKPIDDA